MLFTVSPGQNQQITLSGIPTAVGTYTLILSYYNAQQLSNSSVVASVTGVISVAAAPACAISGTLAKWSSNPNRHTNKCYFRCHMAVYPK